MLLRIAYCDDEIENGKKIRDYINQLMIQIEVEFELDFYVSGTVLLENVKKQNDYYDMVLLDMEMPERIWYNPFFYESVPEGNKL